MIIGVPAETKRDEHRVALLPAGVEQLAGDGHQILVEAAAGAGSGFRDEAYRRAGACVVDQAAEVWSRSELVVKVKEPQAEEYPLMREGQMVFGYFHFAADQELTRACLDAGIVALAFETLRDTRGRLPLLTPMSEVAGRMSIQEGAKYLESPTGGRGVLLGGVPGVAPGRVLVLGAGVVGSNAARMAAGLGAEVTLMDVDLDRLRALDEVMPANVRTIACDPHAVDAAIAEADLVIGSVLIPGDRAPHLVSADQISRMRTGAVVVDVCIDQGGCVETSRPTTHADPIYAVDGVIHYAVANIPGAVARTASQALANATVPYLRELAGGGLEPFLARDPGRAAALNLRAGRLHHPGVRHAFADLEPVGA